MNRGRKQNPENQTDHPPPKLPILDLYLLSKKGIVLNLQLKSCILALGTCFQPKIVCLRLFLFFVCFIG